MTLPVTVTSSSPSSESVLSRFSQTSLENSAPLTGFQSQVDGLISTFASEASNWRSLAAMATGSFFYRFGRIGTLALASRLPQAAPLLQAASYGVGLGTEVVAFEGSSRFFSYAAGDRSNPNLWRWEGNGGFRQGLLSSLITFGLLKSAGHFAQGQNVLVQHFFSDLAMVGGHQVGAFLNFTPRPEGSFAEQMLHAEATNLQLGAGMALLHQAAPGISAWERSLDLSLRSMATEGVSSASSPFSPLPRWALEISNAQHIGPERVFSELKPLSDFLTMSSQNGEGDGERPPSSRGIIRGEVYERPAEAGSKSSTEILRHSLEIGLGSFLKLHPHGVAIFKLEGGDRFGRILLGNENLQRMLGYTLEEAVRMSLLDFFHPEDAPPLAQNIRISSETETFDLREVRLRRVDGSYLWCDVKGGVGTFNGQRVGFTFVEDVSERRRTTEALKASEAQNRLILEAVPDAVMRIGRDGTIHDLRAKRARDLLFPPTLLLGSRIEALPLPPELVQEGLHFIERALDSGEPQTFEYSVPTEEGTRHQEARLVPIDPHEVVAFVRDVTEMKRAEAHRLDLGRLEMIKMVASGLAHDINGALTGVTFPLTGIQSAIQRLRQSPEFASLPPRSVAVIDFIDRNLQKMMEQSERIRTMNAEFRELNAVYSPGPPFELHRLLERDHLHPFLDPVTQIDFRLAGEAWMVPGDATLVDRVIINLVRNAEDAMREREEKRLLVETENISLDQDHLSKLVSPFFISSVRPGEFVKLRIQDTGIGMDEATLNRIFEPFFTLKEKSSGGHGGLGMTITRQIVQALGGFITVESMPDRGSAFNVYLPRIEAKEKPSSPEIPEGRGKISSSFPPPVLAGTDPFHAHLLEEEPLMIVVTDPEGNIVYANGEGRRALGNESVGRRFNDYFDSPDGESRGVRLRTQRGRDLLLEDRQHPFISQFTVHYLLDVTGQEQLQDEIVRLQIKASEGFLARGVLHDARSSLSLAFLLLPRLWEIVRSSAQTERATSGDDLKSPEELLRRIQDSLEETLQIMESGKNILRGGSSDLSLQDLLLDVLKQNFYLQASGGAIQLRLQVQPHLGVYGNRSGLAEALRNILDNACQVMPQGGELTVRAYTQDRSAIIEVTDTGSGITPENLGQIFKEDFTTKPQGSGLGLPMVKRIIEEGHNGKIEVLSTVGQGTTVRILLPLLKSDPPNSD